MQDFFVGEARALASSAISNAFFVVKCIHLTSNVLIKKTKWLNSEKNNVVHY